MLTGRGKPARLFGGMVSWQASVISVAFWALIGLAIYGAFQ